MGLSSVILGKLHQHLGFGFKLGKLAFRSAGCFASHRPLAVAELCAAFLIAQKSGKAVLGYYAARILVSKHRSAGRAQNALCLLAAHGVDIEQCVLQREALLSMLEKTASQSQDSQVAWARAGYLFAAEMLGRCVVDTNVRCKFSGPSGAFSLEKCLKRFYSTGNSAKLMSVLRRRSAESGDGNVSKEVIDKELSPIVDQVWSEMRNKLKMAAIDALLL